MISILINGILGQMGRAVYHACNASDGAFFAAVGVDISAPQNPGEWNCPIYRSLNDVTEKVDAIIDFTIPAALPELLRYAQRKHIPLVLGTTGLSERDLRLIQTAAERTPIFQTGNMSLGVNLQLALAKAAAATLGLDYDVEIIEKHHRKKIDAPSGTALMLANCVAAQRPGGMEYAYGRHEKNKRRPDKELGIHSIRGGTIVGEHQVLFIGNDEVVEITHKAYSKQVFVRGALRAAQYLQTKESGVYNMENVVTEHDVASHVYTLENQAAAVLSGAPVNSGAAGRIFDQIAARGVNVDMIAMTHGVDNDCSIGFSCAQAQLPDALDALHGLIRNEYPGMALEVYSDVVKLTVEGVGMALHHGVASQLLSLLANANIHVHLITTSETKIELCVDAVDTIKAVSEIQENLLKD